MPHICVKELWSIVSGNGLWPVRRQSITWNNADLLLIGPLETNFSEVQIKIHNFSFMKMYMKMSSGKWRPFCLGLNVLTFQKTVPIQKIEPRYHEISYILLRYSVSCHSVHCFADSLVVFAFSSCFLWQLVKHLVDTLTPQDRSLAACMKSGQWIKNIGQKICMNKYMSNI